MSKQNSRCSQISNRKGYNHLSTESNTQGRHETFCYFFKVENLRSTVRPCSLGTSISGASLRKSHHHKALKAISVILLKALLSHLSELSMELIQRTSGGFVTVRFLQLNNKKIHHPMPSVLPHQCCGGEDAQEDPSSRSSHPPPGAKPSPAGSSSLASVVSAGDGYGQPCSPAP